MRFTVRSRLPEVRWGPLLRFYLRFGPYVMRYRLRLAVALVCLLAAMGMILLKPWPLKVVIDHVLPSTTGLTPELPPYLAWVTELDSEKTSIKGPIAAFDPEVGRLAFGPLVLQVDEETEFLDEGGHAMDPVPLVAGRRLKARLKREAEGGFRVRRVHLLGGSGGSYRLRGQLEWTGESAEGFQRLELLGVEVVTDASTDWSGLASTQPGAWMNVKGEFDRQGHLLARDIVRPNPAHLLLIACIAVIAIAALEGTFSYAHAVISTRVAHQAVFHVRRKVFAHVQRLPLAFHTQRQTGDLLMRMTGDIQLMRDAMVQSVIFLFSRAVLILGMLVVMFLMSPQLTLLALAAVPTVALVLFRFSDRLRSVARRQRRKEGRIASTMSETLNLIQIVQSFARHDHEDEKLARMNRSSLRAGLRATKMEERMSWAVELIMALGACAVLWMGARLALGGGVSPGELIVFLAYTRSLYKPLRKVSRHTARLSKASACAERILDLLEHEPGTASSVCQVSAPRLRGAVELQGVSLDYEGGSRSALHDVSLSVRPGETVLIVGRTGSGKTSIARLLLRLYDPTGGRLLFDGVDARQYTLESVRDQIAFVLQEPLLFGTTIAENIAYGRPDADREEIERAARRAHAHEFIERLPDGYDTVLGEGGVTLSGGQRQRICLARAAIKDAAILILDEPTSALDRESVAETLEGMRGLLGGTTTFIISHRPGLFPEVDRVVTLDGGRIIEDLGTPEMEEPCSAAS